MQIKSPQNLYRGANSTSWKYHVHVKYGSQEAKLVLVVIQGDELTLLGHNWLKCVKLDWNKIAVIHSTKPELLKILSQKHEALF